MSKNHENRRKEHVAQLAKQVIKKNEGAESQSESEGGLLEQYQVIREDLAKLRDDLTRGYGIAKEAFERKTIVSELMRLRGNL